MSITLVILIAFAAAVLVVAYLIDERTRTRAKVQPWMRKPVSPDIASDTPCVCTCAACIGEAFDELAGTHRAARKPATTVAQLPTSDYAFRTPESQCSCGLYNCKAHEE